MTRISKVLLSALAGAALLDIWIRAIVNFKSELMAALLFIPFLAVETTLLYLLNKAHSVTWNLASTAVAVGLAIPGAVALIAPEMLFNWEDWKTVVIPVAWELKGFFGSFLVVPPLLVSVFGHLRSNNRWRRS